MAAVAGLALVVFSAMTSYLWLGAVGFAVMVAGIVYAVSPGKAKLGIGRSRRHRPPARQGKVASAKSATFMERIEERWERRRRDQW